jgi:hypothetical protein
MENIYKFTNNIKRRKIVNNWRLYYPVNTRAEIVNVAGNTILNGYIKKMR